MCQTGTLHELVYLFERAPAGGAAGRERWREAGSLLNGEFNAGLSQSLE